MQRRKHAGARQNGGGNPADSCRAVFGFQDAGQSLLQQQDFQQKP